jgi:hypothetical protein
MLEADDNYCEAKHCRQPSHLTYEREHPRKVEGFRLCWDHWDRLCAAQDVGCEDQYRRAIGMPPCEYSPLQAAP